MSRGGGGGDEGRKDCRGGAGGAQGPELCRATPYTIYAGRNLQTILTQRHAMHVYTHTRQCAPYRQDGCLIHQVGQRCCTPASRRLSHLQHHITHNHVAANTVKTVVVRLFATEASPATRFVAATTTAKRSVAHWSDTQIRPHTHARTHPPTHRMQTGGGGGDATVLRFLPVPCVAVIPPPNDTHTPCSRGCRLQRACCGRGT